MNLVIIEVKVWMKATKNSKILLMREGRPNCLNGTSTKVSSKTPKIHEEPCQT